MGEFGLRGDYAQENLYYYPPPGSPLSDAKRYTYDTLYRLIQATGLERQGTASFGSSDNTDDAPWMAVHPMDPSAMQTYTQNYLYDAVGNILQLQHIGATAGSYTRNYAYGSGNSKLNSTQIGATNYPYTYDSRGNMITMPHLSTMDWNGLNELQHTDNGTVETYFNYSGGQRIRKVCVKAGGIEEHRIYLGSYEIYRKFVSSSLTQERLTVHVSDDTGRIAMVETETTPTPDTRIRYIYSNHLQSATLELDDSCAIISYEEYHPFGTTAFQSSDTAINAVAKRYRYTGKERDEETGLYYHGARYYIPWLARWSASDPLEAKYSPWSSYNYGFDNPVMFNDTTGMGPEGKVINNVAQASTTSTPYHVGEGGIMESNTFEIARSAPPGSDPNTIAPIKGSFHDGMYAINDVSSATGKSRQYWISAQQLGEFNTQFSYFNGGEWVPYWNNKEVHETTTKAAADATKAIVVGTIFAPAAALLAGTAGGVVASGAAVEAFWGATAYTLSNPATVGGVVAGGLEVVAGYDGPSANPVVAAEKAAVSATEEIVEQSVKRSDEVIDLAKKFDPAAFADEIVAINKKTEGAGELLNGTPQSAIFTAMYYDDISDQGAAIFRSISHGHMFTDGNKRTAVEAFKSFAKQFGITTVSDKQMYSIATKVAEGKITDVSTIAKYLIKK